METKCIEWSQWKRDPQDPCLEVRYCLEYEKIEEKEPSLISKILGSETVGKIKKFSAIEPNGGGGSGSSDDDNDDEYGDDFVPEIRLDVYNKYINNCNYDRASAKLDLRRIDSTLSDEELVTIVCGWEESRQSVGECGEEIPGECLPPEETEETEGYFIPADQLPFLALIGVAVLLIAK